MQQPLMMQPHLGTYPSHNVTTEIIQKYLDENKQLILAILDNQNLGKMNECAAYQARLQANLMYLAAIADSQPQPVPIPQQVHSSGSMMPGGVNYNTHQHAQQQQQQAVMASRNPLLYSQPSLLSIHQQQQAVAAHHAHHAGGSNGFGNIHSGSSSGLSNNNNNALSNGAFPDYNNRTANGGEDFQISSRGIGVTRSDGSGPDGMHLAPRGGNGGSISGQSTPKESETSYHKASEEGK